MDQWILCWLDDLRLRSWLAAGNLEAANRWARDSGLSPDDPLRYQHDLHHQNLARVLVAQSATGSMRLFKTLRLLGRLSEAEMIIQRVLQALSKTGRMHGPIAGKPELCWEDMLRERGHKKAAQDWLNRGLLHARQYKVPYDIISAIVYKVKWFFSERLWDDASYLLDEGVPLLKTYSIPPSIAVSWTLCQANVCL